MLKFANDVFSETSSLGKVANQQSDLDKLYKWSEHWQVLFNAEKCKCLHKKASFLCAIPPRSS